MTGLTIERVPVAALTPHPQNARVGDVGLICESLERLGQFRPLGVQRSTGYLVFGNHTRQAQVHLRTQYRQLSDAQIRAKLTAMGTAPNVIEHVVADRWETMEVTHLDIDDDTALRILLVDNRSQDVADYDWDQVTELLKQTPDLTGTGFTQGELDALVEVQSWNAAIEDEDETIPEPEDVESIDEIPAESTVHTLNIDVWFPTKNPWGVPELLPDMIPAVPDDMTTWCGPVISTQDDDGKRPFFYVYSTDSTRTMPWERTTVGFYIHDQRFENWWLTPDYYVQRLLNANVFALTVPDYSMFSDMPQMLRQWNLYRAYWIGRFAQEAGMQVIPNLMYNNERDMEWSLAGIPPQPETLMVQVQTNDRNPGTERESTRLLKLAVGTVQPKTLIVYAGPRGRRMVDQARLDCRVMFTPNRSELKDAHRVVRDGALRAT